MTDEERQKVELEVRQECAQIAYLESKYWSIVESNTEPLTSICIGAVGASANIVAAILLGKSAEEVEQDITNRQTKESTNK